MAEALARETLVLPRGQRYVSFSNPKKSPLCARFPRCSSVAVEDERGSSQIGGFQQGRLVSEGPATLPMRRNLDSPHAKVLWFLWALIWVNLFSSFDRFRVPLF